MLLGTVRLRRHPHFCGWLAKMCFSQIFSDFFSPHLLDGKDSVFPIPRVKAWSGCAFESSFDSPFQFPDYLVGLFWADLKVQILFINLNCPFILFSWWDWKWTMEEQILLWKVGKGLYWCTDKYSVVFQVEYNRMWLVEIRMLMRDGDWRQEH